MRISNPISEEEADSGGFEPWKAGTYDFTVQECSDELSQSGNEMIKLTLHIFNSEGAYRIVFDYLVDTPKTQYKVRHFASAVGLTDRYEAGELDINEIFERSGRLKLGVEPAKGEYPAKNKVIDYVKAEDIAAPKPATRPAPAAAKSAPARQPPARAPASRAGSIAADLSDEIPFAPCWQ